MLKSAMFLIMASVLCMASDKHDNGKYAFLTQEMIDAIRIPKDKDAPHHMKELMNKTKVEGLPMALRDEKLQRTPLMWAAYDNNQDLVALFIQQGADINAKDIDGRTALMLATTRDHAGVVGYLLGQKGIDPNLRDNDGYTALMIGVLKGSVNSVQEILKRSATDICVTRKIGNGSRNAVQGQCKGLTALQMAEFPIDESDSDLKHARMKIRDLLADAKEKLDKEHQELEGVAKKQEKKRIESIKKDADEKKDKKKRGDKILDRLLGRPREGSVVTPVSTSVPKTSTLPTATDFAQQKADKARAAALQHRRSSGYVPSSSMPNKSNLDSDSDSEQEVRGGQSVDDDDELVKLLGLKDKKTLRDLREAGLLPENMSLPPR